MNEIINIIKQYNIIMTIPPLAKEVLNDYINDKEITIDFIYGGINAVNKIKKLFFPNNESKASIWAKHWNNEEQQHAIFFVYTLQQMGETKIGFKFVIGESDTGSILGEIHDYEKGIIILENITKT